MSKTMYQHYSGSRSTTDLLEIPSHLAELFLSDYSFVRKFAITDKREPISREIFEKMTCEEIFRFINLEETLYFSSLDVDLNSFTADQKIEDEVLLEINERN